MSLRRIFAHLIPGSHAARRRAPRPPGTPPTIGFSGSEGTEGRALSLIAAFHLAAKRLEGCRLVALDVVSPDVELALEALRFDSGLDVTVLAPAGGAASRNVLASLDLFVAIVRQEVGHLPLRGAVRNAVPVVLAAEASHLPAAAVPWAPTRFALDSRAMAGLIADLVARWQVRASLDQREIAAAIAA